MIFVKIPDCISPLISTIAVVLALLSLIFTLRNARKNIRLSIQQAVIKIAIEKAKDCNMAWEKSVVSDVAVLNYHFHNDVISEMLISKEIILRSFSVYQKLEKKVVEEKEDYAFIFWKQLKPAVRGFFSSTAVEIALNMNYKTTYAGQLLAVNEFIKAHNENKKARELFEMLQQLPSEEDFRVKMKAN